MTGISEILVLVLLITCILILPRMFKGEPQKKISSSKKKEKTHGQTPTQHSFHTSLSFNHGALSQTVEGSPDFLSFLWCSPCLSFLGHHLGDGRKKEIRSHYFIVLYCFGNEF